MGATLKQVALLLGLATAAFGAYYLYMQQGTAGLDAAASEQSLQAMLANTSVFITYSQELDQINLDLSLFEDQRFRSLTLYTQPVQAEAVGRSNPFSETN